METNQNIKIDNRNLASITGVNNIKSFDAKEFILDTKLGTLVVLGNDLVLGKMDLANGEVLIKGNIDSFKYEDLKKDKESLIKRLFK